MKTIIRRATKKDFEAVKGLDKEFFLWACKINPWLDKNYVKTRHGRRFRHDFFDKNEVFFVAEDNGKLVGYAEGIIERLNPKFKNKEAGVLESLYVTPQYRAIGIGEKLSREVLKWFKSKGIREYKLMVHHANVKAYKLYEKLGFKDYFWMLRQ